MFSKQEKKEIAQKVEEILLSYNHPEMPLVKPDFTLCVLGKELWAWADIEANWKYENEEPS